MCKKINHNRMEAERRVKLSKVKIMFESGFLHEHGHAGGTSKQQRWLPAVLHNKWGKYEKNAHDKSPKYYLAGSCRSSQPNYMRKNHNEVRLLRLQSELTTWLTIVHGGFKYSQWMLIVYKLMNIPRIL